MPNSKQAAKRLRQDAKRRENNKRRSSQMKNNIKAAMESIATGNADEAKVAVATAMSKIDKAAKKNVIHDNTASRKKALLSRKLRDMGKVSQEG